MLAISEQSIEGITMVDGGCKAETVLHFFIKLI